MFNGQKEKSRKLVETLNLDLLERLSPRSQAAFKMEDQPGTSEFNGNYLIDVEQEKTVDVESAHDERTSEN